jgi:SEC-C motif/Protein of unknown function (DUF2384)
MKPGRNDACPCGSGKKYKHCCLAPASGSAKEETARIWRSVRRSIDGYPPKLMRFIDEAYGPTAVDEAWAEFTAWQGEDFEPGISLQGMFLPWMFHHWYPDPLEKTQVENAQLHGVPPSRAWLDAMGHRVEPLLRAYFESCIAAPFSFHEILSVEPPTSLRVRDILTGEEAQVLEQAAMATVGRSDILFGLLVRVQGIQMFATCGPVAIPPIHKLAIISQRERMEKTGVVDGQSVRDWDLELRELFFGIAETVINPPMPRLMNTDNEPMEPRTLHYEIDSPQAAFDALKDLDTNATEEERLDEATRDANGQVEKALLHWVKPGNPAHTSLETVLAGRIWIDGRTLKAEVNSAGRDKAFRGIIKRALGRQARYRSTTEQAIEDIVPPPPEGGTSASGLQFSPRDAEQEALMARPEVREHLNGVIRKHYEAWADQPIPALNGKTPRQALRTPTGRESVEALLAQFERDESRLDPNRDPSILAGLRARLGLGA